MQQRAVKFTVQEAMREVKSFDVEGDYRAAARQAIKEVLESRMANRVDEYLSELDRLDISDRRNGSYDRHLLTACGDVSISVKRTRQFSGLGVIKAFERRDSSIDQLIMNCFTLGLATRKVGVALLPVLGEKISRSTVSEVSKQLDAFVDAYHKRSLNNKYRFLMFDGVVLKNRTGAGSVKKVVLVALGVTHDNKKEVIDFKLACGESQSSWESFLNDLYRRGITGEGVDLIVVDGGTGLLAALDMVYSGIPVQRCWAHKTHNVINCVKEKDQKAVKYDLHKISHASGEREAQSMFKEFALKWGKIYPKAVLCLRKDIDTLLSFFKIKDLNLWNTIRTTNAIERRFVEVRRRTRPMGVFSNRTSMERILFAVFRYENIKEGTATPLLMTQN
ncbi:MAG: IS256 family transposase [Candidatus Schekmanbacteria bacterium]|nr:IS256 family transposase [Candidatus Schekmanbacteria bacterium]